MMVRAIFSASLILLGGAARAMAISDGYAASPTGSSRMWAIVCTAVAALAAGALAFKNARRTHLD